jgi:hypothetical protein
MLRAASTVATALAIVAVAGCNRPSITAPDVVSSAPTASPVAVTARLDPGVVTATPVAGFVCPAIPPFTSTFDLVLQSQTLATMSVGQVTFHFLDGANVTSQPITFANGTLVPTNSTVTLPFTTQFGCGIGAPRSVVVDVKLLDSSGTAHMLTVRADTR